LTPTPDGFIGHSVGEIACAYADGCLTAEQAITISYLRGQALATVEKGKMAAVQIDHDQLLGELSEDLVIACYNGPDSYTVAGAGGAVEELVARLRSKGVLAKEVGSCGMAFHSTHSSNDF
jgi:fatty acid synthase